MRPRDPAHEHSFGLPRRSRCRPTIDGRPEPDESHREGQPWSLHRAPPQNDSVRHEPVKERRGITCANVLNLRIEGTWLRRHDRTATRRDCIVWMSLPVKMRISQRSETPPLISLRHNRKVLYPGLNESQGRAF